MVTVGDDVTVTYRMPEAGRWHGHPDRPVVRVVRRDRHVGHRRGRDRPARSRRLPRGPRRRRRRRRRHQRALRAAHRRAGRPDHRRVDVRRGRPGHRALDRRAGQPVGLDRRLPGRRCRPGAGRLPASGATPAATTPAPCRRAPRASCVLGRDHQGRPWPLPPGRYVVHYLLTDQYVSVGVDDVHRARGIGVIRPRRPCGPSVDSRSSPVHLFPSHVARSRLQGHRGANRKLSREAR